MKYVMFKKKAVDGSYHFVPIIFPDFMVHSDIADQMMNGSLKEYTVHSAGSIASYSMDEKSVNGFSVSLDVASDVRDGKRIKFNDYWFGYDN